MNVRKIIQKSVRRKLGGVDLASEVNAVVSANVGERGTTTASSSSPATPPGREPRGS